MCRRYEGEAVVEYQLSSRSIYPRAGWVAPALVGLHSDVHDLPQRLNHVVNRLLVV